MAQICDLIRLGAVFHPFAVSDDCADRTATAAGIERGISRSNCVSGSIGAVLLVYRDVLPIFAGIRIPCLGRDHAGVALFVWTDPDPWQCIQLYMVSAQKRTIP